MLKTFFFGITLVPINCILLISRPTNVRSCMRTFSTNCESRVTNPLKASVDYDGSMCNRIDTHYIFLVHGWMGNNLEMSYISKALKDSITKMQELNAPKNRIVVHSTIKNDGRTADGIARGGERLAEEIQQFIVDDVKKRSEECNDCDTKDVTISIVGNSLGGLYARYCLSKLSNHLSFTKGISSGEGNKNNIHKIVLHSNIFVSTATPHLGVSSHTYITLPRSIERGVAYAIGDTGKDLFRFPPIGGENSNDLIFEMGTNYKTFLEPLSAFRKRILYANAFCTDFQVPTNTAAFLCTHSSYQHHIQSGSSPNYIVATLTTDSNEEILNENPSGNDQILAMSTKLDALGWTKVITDVRDLIPIPTFPNPFSSSSRVKFDKIVKESKSLESKRLSSILNRSDRKVFPLGHTVLIANSKNSLYSKLNSNGKPVMDRLANSLISDVLNDWGVK